MSEAIFVEGLAKTYAGAENRAVYALAVFPAVQ